MHHVFGYASLFPKTHLRPVLSAPRQAATKGSLVVPYGGFQGFPDVTAHASCGQRGTAHLLPSVAATVHGLIHTR